MLGEIQFITKNTDYKQVPKFEYENVIPELTISRIISCLKNEGNIAYEYNPLRNFRYLKEYLDKLDYKGESILQYALQDFDTEKLNFDLNHPVDIQCQPSYDGSVNLILNDNINSPKLINSRFSVRQNNTYEIVDRVGTNDTNLYDYELFDLDTSLYKRVNKIPKIQFVGLTHGGKMPVGNYHFYFKYCDADGNETDFVGESGTIVCHIGSINDPKSIRGGLLDENSDKLIQLCVSNIDTAYDYLTVYYSRETSSGNLGSIITARKIKRKFKVRGSTCFITVDGFEKTLEIPITDINLLYFIADKAKTQAICLNRLFLANLGKPSVDYLNLSDLSLRMLPYYNKQTANDLIGNLDLNYNEVSSIDGFEYYNTLNIYNKLGYWDEEIYRLGVVYIMNDDSLSPVFNVRGRDSIPNGSSNIFNSYSNTNYHKVPIKEGSEEKIFKPITYDELTYLIGDKGFRENAKGVIRINDTNSDKMNVYSIGIYVEPEILKELYKYNVKGLFFVRQKRIPTILALAFVIGHDINTGIPLIPYNGKYYSESFINKFGNLNASYKDRLFESKEHFNNECAICPEYELRLPHFNNIFTDTEFVVKAPHIQIKGNLLNRDTYQSRHYYSIEYLHNNDDLFKFPSILAINDGVPFKRNEISKYCASIGDSENITIFKCVGKDRKFKNFNDKKADNNCIVRGNYGPFLGLSGYKGKPNQIINIYIPGYSLGKLGQYFRIRYEDTSPFFAISDRFTIEELLREDPVNLFRGDCYICNYTHRLNRNFQDPEVPNADIVVNDYTWRDHYNTEKPEDMDKINRGDINSVQLGSWFTIKLRSNINLSMRDLNFDYADEASLTGVYRTFYPLSEMSTSGNYKIPESNYINNGISTTLSQKQNLVLPEVPYLKNTYQNRIAYSDIAVNEAFKNGFRVFPLGNYRDYQSIYGGITKLIELSGNLLCILEHGILLIPINERVQTGNGLGGEVFLNSVNVLPMNPKVISDTFGSQWGDSVIKTDLGVYGIDTVAKKIWRTNGNSIELLSDGKVLKFLNDNISLEERELTPIIGIRNVKTHYNPFKHDVMFTFYDNMYGFEDKAWNLCFNELLNLFQTFYSWIPSYSESIDNVYFSFNRDTSKWISKLGTTSNAATTADGITLEDVTMPGNRTTLNIKNRSLPNSDKTGIKYSIKYILNRDIYNNYKYFNILGNLLIFNGTDLNDLVSTDNPVILLNIEAIINISDPADTSFKLALNAYKKDFDSYFSYNSGFYKSQVAVVPSKVLNNMGITPEDKKLPNLGTDFWKHGQAGIIDIKDSIEPCKWYGKLHPFELEFIVNVNPETHKIFDLLHIISNSAEPESFHYEIVGDCFDFADDKLNIYVRLELTKYLYQFNGCDITWDRKASKMKTQQREIFGLPGKYDRSTIFPLYYSRLDTINSVYDYYKGATSPNKNYDNLSGTEVVYYDSLKEFRLNNHVKAVNIQGPGGRLRGNMDYQEDKWRILMNPIVIKQKNEPKWYKDIVPLSIGNSPIPDIILEKGKITIPDDLQNAVDQTLWLSPQGRGEIKLKDKFIKIKIRYSGNKLAIISGVRTLFRIVS